jgi:2-desacetyl-2-hydroxyethyl bacteriochlorophyllide A dehydrogenase
VTSRAACVVLTGPQAVQVQAMERSAPEPGWVTVRTARAGICGSDLHTYRRGHPWREYPLKPGHEAAGVLAELGSGVAGLSVGDRVYLMPEMPCGTCRCCVRGQPNLCASPGGVGGSVPGAMADFFLAPRACVRRIPPGVSVRAASLIEPLAAALHAVDRAGTVRERAVVVIGGGTIGLLVMLACNTRGAGQVVLCEPVPSKREAAVAMGAARALDPLTAGPEGIREAAGDSSYVIFDCVGVPDSLTLSVELAMRGGTVVVVGAPHGDATMPIERMHHGEVTITGSVLYSDADFRRAEDLLVGGLPVEQLITHEFALGDAAEAFRAALSGEEIKVQLVPDLSPAASEAAAP